MNDNDEYETIEENEEEVNYSIRVKWVPIVSIIGAVTLILTNHNDGWGWLILLAYLSA